MMSGAAAAMTGKIPESWWAAITDDPDTARNASLKYNAMAKSMADKHFEEQFKKDGLIT
jgi:hypothetical protein